MTESAQRCPKCRVAAPPGASFCSSCGAALVAAAPPAPQPVRAVPPAERAILRGPCTLLFAGEEELDIRRVGHTLAEKAGRPLSDVTRDLRASKGFLARSLDAAEAVRLAEQLEGELLAPVLVIPDAEIVPLPPALRMRRIAINSSGIRCDAYSWDSTEPLKLTWAELFLISCARLEVQEVVESHEEGGATDMIGRRLPNLITTTRTEYVLDIVLRDPWRRLRLDQNTAAFSLTELRRDRDQALGTLHRSLMQLERYAEGVPSNRGLMLLASGAPEAVCQSVTFQNKRDFDSYTHWLIQLVRFGRSIAEQ